jgi:hypothetical protein
MSRQNHYVKIIQCFSQRIKLHLYVKRSGIPFIVYVVYELSKLQDVHKLQLNTQLIKDV